MPVPGNWTTVTLTGEIQLLGDALRGTVTFTPSEWVTNPGANVIQPPSGKRVNLDSGGRFSVVLPVADDVDILPTGWTYRVDLDLVVPSTGARVTRSYDIQLTASMAPTVDLADLTPTTPVADVSPYLRWVDVFTTTTGATWTGTVDGTTLASTAQTISVTLTGNTTLNLPTPSTSRGYTVALVIKQDATGGRTLTLPQCKFAYGVAPVLSTAGGATDVLHLMWTGVQWIALMGAQAVA